MYILFQALTVTKLSYKGHFPPSLYARVCSAVHGPALCCTAGTLHSAETHMQCNYNAPQLWP